MIEIKPMNESCIHIDCLHNGPVDSSAGPTKGRQRQDGPVVGQLRFNPLNIGPPCQGDWRNNLQEVQ
ncbi:hypothetical protein ACFL1X_06385 [Candidatus Hydrogenedentota bacterium]